MGLENTQLTKKMFLVFCMVLYMVTLVTSKVYATKATMKSIINAFTNKAVAVKSL